MGDRISISGDSMLNETLNRGALSAALAATEWIFFLGLTHCNFLSFFFSTKSKSENIVKQNNKWEKCSEIDKQTNIKKEETHIFSPHLSTAVFSGSSTKGSISGAPFFYKSDHWRATKVKDRIQCRSCFMHSHGELAAYSAWMICCWEFPEEKKRLH